MVSSTRLHATMKPDRRKLLKAVGTGIATSSGLGIATAGAAGAEGDAPDLNELTGKDKNKLRSKAQKSSEYKKLKRHVMKTYDVTPDIDKASAYKIENDDETRYGVEVPFAGMKNTVHSAIAIFIQDGEVSSGTGGTAKVDGERVVEYTQFKISTEGEVTTQSIPLATDKDRQAMIDDYGPSGIQITSQCSSCEWAVNRICGWGCGISGAFFCGAISVSFPVAGIGCAAFFALYCYELDASGTCYIKGSAKGDCEFMGYC